ncbi:heavy metal translocating P-type ATPase [Pseudodesulfovibrio sp.]|uniref:heavy metal translocating P-type ATPase n=1 Tax=unclassified Pseudodesulfovibrio TaxID=2661612 RepID=UPI003AFFA432
MTTAPASGPHPVHETSHRIRLRWNRLLDPGLRPDWLEAWLANLPGVDKARVNPAGRTIVLYYDGDTAHRAALIDAMARIPSKAFSGMVRTAPRQRLIDAATTGAAAALLPLTPLPVQAVAGTAMGLPHVLRGADTLINEGLKARVLDMTTIGVSLLRADFTTAASISAMVVLGEYLRTMSDDKSNALLRRLVADPVDSVRVERDGREICVPFNEPVPGDIAICGQGEVLTVDGEIVEGEAILDLSSITGEAAPVHVAPGDAVVSGSGIIEGTLRIKAHRTGQGTSMARIAALMARAAAEPSSAEVRSTKLADALTPVTLGLGAALYAATGDLNRALSALTVDFACAVKFPAPVVVRTSMHAASRAGAIIKTGRGLETLGVVDAVVFDKTGTLTRGDLSVTDLNPVEGMGKDDLLRLAASVEDRQGHPIGRAILAEANRRGLAVPAPEHTDRSVAHGISGTVGGALIRVGSRHFLCDDCGIDCGSLAPQAETFRGEGKSLVWVAKDERLIGLAALRDTLRPEAHRVLKDLRENGVKKIILLTGDHAATAEMLAAELPMLDKIQAGLTPEGKAAEVARLKGEGFTVAVVGDGINDAPAFASADVGICMSRATGLARDSAQIVLTRNSLDGLTAVHRIARRADNILRQCFTEGVGVNIGLLLAASAGHLSPTVAAAMHNANTFVLLGAAALAASREVSP